MRCFQLLAVLAVVGAVAMPASAQTTIYVNGATGNDAWDGLCETWDGVTLCGPKATIQAGIDATIGLGDEVVIADGTYTGIDNKNLDVGGKAITVRSASGDPEFCVIDCENDGRGFYFHSFEEADSVVEGLTIANGYVDADNEGSGDGGGVYCHNSSPTLAYCAIRDNTADGYAIDGNGGGIYCYNSDPALDHCTITGNNSECYYPVGGKGGGVFCHNSSPMLTECTIRENSACTDGGGIHCEEHCSPTITGCTISDNSADAGDGGGLRAPNSGTLMLNDCSFDGNSAYTYGGGLHCGGTCTLSLTNCTLSDNSTNFAGGAISSIDESNTTLTSCTINGNYSLNYCGGVYCDNTSSVLTDCAITANVGNYSGGVYCYYTDATITNCTISENTAEGKFNQRDGGGGVYCYHSSPRLTDCTISDNAADGTDGGGFYCYWYSSPLITNCTISGNTAHANGGGIYGNEHCSPVLTNCKISGNKANDDGGGVYLYYSHNLATLTNCTISGNIANDNCGGFVSVGGGGITLTNSIFWSNEPLLLCGYAVASYSDIEGGFYGDEIIAADPAFADPGYWDANGTPGDPNDDFWVDGDYSLLPGSPCIDSGDNTAVPPDESDLDGDGDTAERAPLDLGFLPRFVNDPDTVDSGVANPPNYPNVVDMGAHEFQVASFPVGDLNCDGTVNLFDIDPFVLALTSASNATPFDDYYAAWPTCDAMLADINADSSVNLFDIDPFVALLTGK